MNAAERLNPFPGLRSFEEDEDHLFFGRARDLDELLRRLRHTRFLAVLGTSGSGKSSLVKSGLIPSLHAGFMSRGGSSWRIAVTRPGEDPIGHLADALNAPDLLGGDDDELRSMNRSILESTLRRGDLGLVETVREARLPERDRVLVVVDQFEELFRFKRSRKIAGSRDDAVAFVQLLLAAARVKAGSIYVVITMRSDFIGQSTEIPRLTEAINRGQYLVPFMNRDQRRSAVTGPVAVGGATMSPRLVLRLLNDVGDNADQLPILQHALMRTWDRWETDHADGEPLDARHYEAVGTMSSALDRHAEEAFAELGSERQRKIAEKLFKCLTEGGAGQGVRRPSPVREICAVAEADLDEVVAVIDTFRQPGRTFLMPPAGTELGPDSVVDISHESLMRVWKRLIRWVGEETEAARSYARLAGAAAHHTAGTGALWRDPELGFGLQWREKHQPSKAWGERYDPHFERAVTFLEASREEHERELARRDAERQRKLRQARILAVVMSVAAVLILAFGVWALTLKFVADEARREADELRATAEENEQEARDERAAADRARQQAETARDEAVRERRRAEEQESIADEQRTEAQRQERIALRQQRIALEQKEKADRARETATAAKQEAEEQREVADEQREEADEQRREAVTQRERAQRLRRIAEAKALANQTLSLQEPGQQELAALLARQAWQLHLAADGAAEDSEIYNALRLAVGRLGTERVEVLATLDGTVRTLAVSSDGRTLAAGSDRGAIRLSDLERPGSEPELLATLPAGARSLDLDPASRRLAAGDDDGGLRVFDLENRSAPPRVLIENGPIVAALAFDPRGEILASGGGGRIELRDAASPRDATAALDAGGDVADLAFSPDGATLAAAVTDRGVLLWQRGRFDDAPRVLDGEPDPRSVAWSRDGGRLAAGALGGRIVLWGPERSNPVELVAHTARVSDLDFHPERDLLASASFDGTVRLWDAERPDAAPLVLQGHGSWVWTAVFSPDGEKLLSGSNDLTVRLWTTKSAVLAEEICGAVDRDLTESEWAEYLPEGAQYEATCPALKGS